MAEAFQFLLFGDETGDFREPLQKLCQRQRGIIFSHFMEGLNHTLRDEVRRQPRYVKKLIPPFTDVRDLVTQYQDSTSRNQILETTLTCICQLGTVIRCVLRNWVMSKRNNSLHSFFDDHPSQYIVPSNTVLVGLCTGMLAATAVSASHSVLDLVANALRVVRVAFRIGVKVNDTAQRLSGTHDVHASQSWSRLVVGVQKEASITEVEEFNERKVRIIAWSIFVFNMELNYVLGLTAC